MNRRDRIRALPSLFPMVHCESAMARISEEKLKRNSWTLDACAPSIFLMPQLRNQCTFATAGKFANGKTSCKEKRREDALLLL
jgi:hypothetical protein